MAAKSQKSSNRRGPLSADEKVYIRRNAADKKISQIALYLKRNERSVKKFIIENDLHSPDLKNVTSEESDVLNVLHSLPWWQMQKSQLSSKELPYFEQQWVRLYQQFDYDVLPSEEIQMRKFIMLDILRDRCLTKIRLLEADGSALESQYQKELQKSRDDRDEMLIKNITSRLSAIPKNITELNKEIKDLLSEQSKLETDLSASRNDRIKNIQDANKNFSAALRLLEDSQTRKDLGKYIEIMRAAAGKEMYRLCRIHKFIDDEYDRPILSGKLEEIYKETDKIHEQELDNEYGSN